MLKLSLSAQQFLQRIAGRCLDAADRIKVWRDVRLRNVDRSL